MVTGAGSGIGRATALLFAKNGANVVCADWNLETAQETAQMIKDGGVGDGVAVKTDVSVESQVRQGCFVLRS